MALMVRPWAYSGPQCMAAHPPSLSLRCHFCRRCWLASPLSCASSPIASASRKGGRCSSSQARNSSRNFSSSGARAKSTGEGYPTAVYSDAGVREWHGDERDVGESVDFTYDDEQLALQEVARGALERECGPDVVRRLADEADGITPALWSTLAALGWTGLLVPEKYGGSGAGLLEMCVVLEEMGRVPLPGPFFSSSVAATLAARALGASDLLTDLASGARRGTVALGEQGHGEPVSTVRTRARRKAAQWVVSGEKPIVVDGHTADWVIVVARSEEGVRSYLLESPEGTLVPSLDPTRKLARLVLDDTPGTPMGPGGQQAGRGWGGACSTPSPLGWWPRRSVRPIVPSPRRSPTRRNGSCSTSLSRRTRRCA